MDPSEFFDRRWPRANAANFFGSDRFQPAFFTLQVPTRNIQNRSQHFARASRTADAGVSVVFRVVHCFIFVLVTQTSQHVRLCVLKRPECARVALGIRSTSAITDAVTNIYVLIIVLRVDDIFDRMTLELGSNPFTALVADSFESLPAVLEPART